MTEWLTLYCVKCFEGKDFLKSTAPSKYICKECTKAYEQIEQQSQEEEWVMDVYKLIRYAGIKNAERKVLDCNQPKHENTLERLIQ